MFLHATNLPQAELGAAIIHNPLVVTPDTTVMEAIAAMASGPALGQVSRSTPAALEERLLEARCSCVLVVEAGQLLGILTERDVVELITQKLNLDLPIAQVMTRSVITLRESEFTNLFFAIGVLQQHQIRHLPIVDQENHLVGLLTYESLQRLSHPVDLLHLRLVMEVMVSQVVWAGAEATLLEVARLMARHRVSSVVIVQPQVDQSAQTRQRPIGIVTERDIVQSQALGLSLETCQAHAVMSQPVFAVRPEDSLWTVKQLMEQHLIRRLVVTDATGELLGIITQSTLLQALNPMELYKLADGLGQRVSRLEAEKVELLKQRTLELEQQVEERTLALKARADRESLIAKIATQIRSSLDLQEILQTTVVEVQKLLACDRVNIWQFEADWQSVVVAESTDSPLSLIGLRIDDPCFKRAQAEICRQGEIRVVNDIFTTEMQDCHREMLIRFHTRAKILVPLLCENKLWGLLNATESNHPRDWQLEEVELLQALSLHLAIALQQATVHQQLQVELADRRQTQQALTESERRLSILIGNLPGYVYRVQNNPSYTPIFISSGVTAITGYTPEEYLIERSVSCGQEIHPADADGVWAIVQASLQNRQSYECEYRLITKTGEEKWVWERGLGIYSEQEELLFLEGFVTEITARKQAEQALCQTRDRLQKAQRISHLGNWELNLQTHTLHWSEEVFRIFEIDPQHFEASYEAFLQVIHPADRDLVNEAYTRHLQDRVPYNLVHRLLLPDGRVRYVQEQCETLYDDAGNPLRSLGTVQDITSLKQTELELERLNLKLEQRVQQRTAQLQEREAQLEDFFENANDLIQSVLLEDGRFEYVNRTWRQTLGYSEAEVAQLTIFDVLHPAYHSHCEQLLQQMRAGKVGTLERMELTFLTKDRREILLEGNLNCRLENDYPVATRAILRDITGRKQAENALRESQQFLQIVLDNFPLAVFWKDRNSVFQGCNRIFLQDANLNSVAELIGKTDYDLPWGKTEADGYRTNDRQVMESDIPKLGIIEPLTRPTGECWLETNKIPLHNLAGEVIGVLGTYQDITARKQAELDLQASENRFRQMFDSSVVGMMVADLQGGIVDANHRFLEIVGYSREDLQSGLIRWDRMTPPEHRAADRTALENLRQYGANQPWEKEYYRKDGSRVPVLIGVTLLPGAEEQAMCVVIDITDRIQAEQKNRQQTDRERLLREITQRIRQSLDLQTIFDTACQEIRQVLQADRVGIFKFYPESHYDDGEFVAEAVVSDYTSVVAIRVHDHCFGKNYATFYAQGRYFVVDDIYQNGLQDCHASILAQFQVRANLVMPLLCGNDLWGLLCIHQCSGPRQWQEFEVMLGHQLSNQLAIAIQQAILYDQIQSELLVRQKAEAKIALQLRQQQTLGAIVQQIRQSLNLDQILSTVSRQVKDLLQGDRVIVFRLFPDGRSQIVEEAVSEGFPSLKAQQWEDETWSQDILDCYWQGRPRIVADVMNDIWTDCLVEYAQAGQIQSKIVAPILQDIQPDEQHRWVAPQATNKLWGILVIHACRERRVWQGAEAQLLQQIANQLAIAIQQANLFKQLQQQLTERQRAQQQLTERNQQLALANQELARATRLKDEFLANMSHELRTPLNAILGMTEGLQEEVFGAVNVQQTKALETVENSASHLLSLINDILDVAKIEAGQIELDCLSVAVAPLCSSSLAFIKQQALQKRIQLETSLPVNLPNLLVDERRIRQVLINLLNNAVKFTPEAGQITLAVSLLPPEAHPDYQQNLLRIAISDTGIGIAPENINKLFRPFVQIDSALNREYSGTGLGLALVKQIVELHGGKVGVTSQLGAGSCFTVDLPCDPETLVLPAVRRPWTTERTLEPELPNSTLAPLILLAEDNEANIITLISYLEAKGYRILLAKNGEEAIAQTRAHHPDLILMDIQMPGMDGLEAMEQIRQDSTLAPIPIIALTALAMANDKERCFAAGASEYLTKPVKLRQLTLVIQQLLGVGQG